MENRNLFIMSAFPSEYPVLSKRKKVYSKAIRIRKMPENSITMVGAFVDKFLLFQIFLPSMSLMLRIWNATPQRSYPLKAHLNRRAAKQVEILPKSFCYVMENTKLTLVVCCGSVFLFRSLVIMLLPDIFPFSCSFLFVLSGSRHQQKWVTYTAESQILGKMNRGNND